MTKNKILTTVIFSLYALITVATSKVTDAPQTTFYSTNTNCSDATTSSGQVIEVSGDTIVTPSNIDFTNLGLPSEKLTIGSDVSGTIAPALNRVCTYSSSTVLNVITHTYTCSDNSTPSCVVTLVPN